MKKILLTVLFAALSIGAVHAQTAEGRTANTKISDGLALLPAPDSAEYNRIMKDFVSTGAQGIDILTSMFTSTNDVPQSYALSGWAAYVSNGDPAARKTFNEGLQRAIEKATDVEVKAFYIRLLQVSGTSESAFFLGQLAVSDPRLREPAISAVKATGATVKFTEGPGPAVTGRAPKPSQLEKLAAEAEAEGKAVMPRILKALDNKDRSYRNAALNLTEDFVDSDVLSMVSGKLSKASTEGKIDIISYLGRHRYTPASEVIAQYVGNGNEELSIASMWAAVAIGGKDVGRVLTNVLSDPQTTETARNAAALALASYNGDISSELAGVVEQGSPEGRAAALKLMGDKRMKTNVEVVMKAATGTDKQVSDAAYEALAGVVGYGQFARLSQMLEQNSDAERTEWLQRALMEALHGLPAERQFSEAKAKMDGSNKKQAYYVILASTGVPQAMDVIVDAYKNGTESDKMQVISALDKWRGDESDSIEQLYYIARDGQGDLASTALTRFVNRVERSGMTAENKTLNYSDALEIARNDNFRTSVVRKLAAVPCFQSLILAGKYLDSDDRTLKQAAVNAVRTIGLSSADYYGPVVTELLTKAASLNTSADSSYEREEIGKFISEMPAGGYVSMFNGRDYTGWKGLVENPVARAKMTPAELAKKQVAADDVMRRDWKIRDGLMVFEGQGYDNICTDVDYGDFEMYVDWLLYPDGPEADGGIYLRGTPQVQMWDIARTNVGAQVGSGGLYNNRTNQSKPLKVADNTLGRWNTFYIKMVADRVTVVLNGEVVTDNVILENYWDRKLPIFPEGQIELQAHGTRVAYRNMFINALERTEPYALSTEEEKEGYRILFDGTNMNAWTGNTNDYVTENGTITLYPSNGHGGNLYTKDEFADFIFRFEFRLTPGANNGLGVRTPMQGDAAYVGMELQILDDDAPIYSNLEQYQYHGSVYGVIPAKRGALKPIGEWNYQEVYIKGDDIRITLNGTVIVDGNIAEASRNGTIDGKSHPGLKNKTGHIGFLGHGSEVSFRNIRIKEL